MTYVINNKNNWEYLIGLEVHAQVSAKSKLFSSSSSKFGASPNTQVSLIDAAMPGTLPVVNKYCIEQIIKTGLAINAKINKVSSFDRKNYFYADLPQGYQISQFYKPIVQSGYINIHDSKGVNKKIRIRSIHLEQDAGKSIHDQYPQYSLIDLNRAGIALMEIVSEPDIRSAYEAEAYITKLRNLLRYIGSCDGNMEQGSMRCDVNISVRHRGAQPGTRCEIKNLNSIKNITKAIQYETTRQMEVIRKGGQIKQETKLFNAYTCKTKTMRNKEDTNEYRYFPDPDLLPIKVDNNLIEQLKSELPELPDAKIQRYISTLGLSRYDAELLVTNKDIANYFEQAIIGANSKTVAHWIIGEIFAKLNKYLMLIDKIKITPIMLRDLTIFIDKGIISRTMAKQIFDTMFETGNSPKEIIQNKKLTKISDHDTLEAIINTIIANNPNAVQNYRKGRKKIFSFFIGQVMKNTLSRADPKTINTILYKKLNS
jgi:aspartyl-tRNA(Asn)/glutamyl-tRNA(Gln) amidotransferase subunit B